jgi:hypothetical protein
MQYPIKVCINFKVSASGTAYIPNRYAPFKEAAINPFAQSI